MGMAGREMGSRGACPCTYSLPSSSELLLLILCLALELQELFHGLGTERGNSFCCCALRGRAIPAFGAPLRAILRKHQNEPRRAGVNADWITPVFSPEAAHFGSCLHWNRYKTAVLTLWATGAAPQPGCVGLVLLRFGSQWEGAVYWTLLFKRFLWQDIVSKASVSGLSVTAE